MARHPAALACGDLFGGGIAQPNIVIEQTRSQRVGTRAALQGDAQQGRRCVDVGWQLRELFQRIAAYQQHARPRKIRVDPFIPPLDGRVLGKSEHARARKVP